MRRRVKKNAGILAALCLVCCASCHDAHDSSTAPRPANTLTLDEIYAHKIMTLLDQEIILYEDILWKMPEKMVVPMGENPIPYLSCLPLITDSSTIPMIKIWLNFDTADHYLVPAFRGRDYGDILIISSDITTTIDSDNNVTKVYYQGKRLTARKPYYLIGTFRYASWVNMRQNADHACLEQLNDVIYWDHTFEFRLTGLSETPPQ